MHMHACADALNALGMPVNFRLVIGTSFEPHDWPVFDVKLVWWFLT